jgi:hypothetical protein
MNGLQQLLDEESERFCWIQLQHRDEVRSMARAAIGKRMGNYVKEFRPPL